MISSLVSTNSLSVVVQFAVDLIATYFSQVVPFIGEEQFIDDTACCFFIGWIGTAQLAVDILTASISELEGSFCKVL
jgi:hypothetical protein